MRPPFRALFLVGALALPLTLAACAREETTTTTETPTTETPTVVVVRDVQLGRSIGGDKRVTDATTSFAPNDVIYATVVTDGSSQGSVVKVRWVAADGTVVDETEQTIAPTGEAVTEFHISKPDGMPAGNYRVEVFLDGQPVQQKDFTITQG